MLTSVLYMLSVYSLWLYDYQYIFLEYSMMGVA
jgi:hypothetical protein